MNDLVNREELIKKAFVYKINGKQLPKVVFLSDIEKTKTIDVEPVVHGHWIQPTVIDGRAFNIPHCSICNEVPCGVDEHTKYCPNCGARMNEMENQDVN